MNMEGQEADFEDDVPELEDMSEELEKIKALRPHKHSNEKQSSCTKPSQTSNADLVSTQKKAVVHSKPKVKHTVDSSSSFGGFKKGFLFASSDSKHQVKKKPVSKSQKTSSSLTASQASTKTSAEGNDIPFIKPKDKDKDKSSLEFPEVQQAMKESFPLLQSQDWVTDDLLSKIRDNPILAEAFNDPSLSQALAQFQSDPQAVAAATKDNPKVQAFFREFCTMMGDHFSVLADKEEKEQASKASTQASLISEVPSSQEEAQMQEIISRPQVKDALSDPVIQQLIVALKEDPNTAQRMLQTGSADFRRKVKVLIDNGLLNFQSS